MCALIRSLALVFLLPMCANAQPAPLVATTLRTTATTSMSICAGANSQSAPTACTGGLQAGVTLLNGLQEDTGLTLNAVTTAQPSIRFANSSTGQLSGLYATNAKGLTIFTNGGSTQAAVFTSSGDATFAAGATVTGALATASAAVAGNTTIGGTLTVGSGDAGVFTLATRVGFVSTASSATGSLVGGAYGTGAIAGAQMNIGQNSSGNGAAGTLVLFGRTNGNNFVWADASGTPGVLRISDSAPQEDGTPSDTSGTVVGSQSSTLDTKTVLGAGVAPADALAVILKTPIFRFRYRGGAYSGSEFQGIAADVSPEFAMDPDDRHPNGRSFNPVSALGYTVQAIKALQAEIDELRATVQALREEAR